MTKIEPLIEPENPKTKVFSKKEREELYVTQGYVVFERKLSNFGSKQDIKLEEGSELEATWLLGKAKNFKPQLSNPSIGASSFQVFPIKADLDHPRKVQEEEEENMYGEEARVRN